MRDVISPAPSRIDKPISALSGRAIPLIVALILLLAAIAKACQTWYGARSAFLAAQITAEIFLAVWLISNLGRTWALRATFLVFVAFAAVSLDKIYAASRSCGCFGPISVPPIYTFPIDVSIVALLVSAILPARRYGKHLSSRVLIPVVIIVLGMTALALARQKPKPTAASIPPTLAQTMPSQDIPDAVATEISPTSWLADLGTQPQGKTLHILFKLTDPADHDLQIRGVNISCGCTSMPMPPQVIHRTGTSDTVVVIHLPHQTGPFSSSSLLTTDSPQLPPLELRVQARLP